MSSILVLVIGQTAIYAQEVVNQNSLVACVDYFNREYETQKEGLSESVQQGLDFTINENMRSLIVVAICDIGYEHTGKYSHLSPKDMQNKYAKLAATQIFLEKKSFEPFNEDMKLDQERVKRWLVHFGLLTRATEWNHIHVSGHGSRDQLGKIIQNSKSDKVIPIHTEHEEYYNKFHNNNINVKLNGSLEL